MTFPATKTVGLHVFSEGVFNGYTTTDTWTPAKNLPGTTTFVYGWYTQPPGQADSAEPAVAGHDRVIGDLVLLTPPGVAIGPHDVVDVPGEGQFEMLGRAEDLNEGPFAFTPGRVYNLRRVEG